MLINLAKLGKYDNGLFTFLPQSAPWILVVPAIERSEPGEFLRNNGIEKILEANGVQFDQQTLDDDFDEFMTFYEKIRRIPVDTQSMNTGHITEQIERNQIPSIDFEKIVENLIDSQKKKAVEMVKNKTLIHKIVFFFGKNDNLETLIQKTSKRVLANFLIINYIDLFTKSLLIDPDDVGKCDEMATDNLPEAGFSVIVKNHFDRENIQIVSDLVEEIKIVLKN
ncbi:Protein CBG25695 [Caenorhabditis briggsae]|uniref:Protein CBG25695 n=1 Tax=Caenorhabditis briggsae TaxID=6238 RepID=B6IKQ1_CAEBR|nr:Protein CBG25695 [Caenorhabditis briggsae]CAS00481.1 Protein CBG25695 [Caenorhabditis briggsae]